MSSVRFRSPAPSSAGFIRDKRGGAEVEGGAPVDDCQGQGRSRPLPGPCALRRARAGIVQARRARQRAGDRRRQRAGGADREGLSRQSQLSRTRHRGHRDMSRPPVDNWSTDFDHLDPRWIEDPYPIWESLRGTCPIAHTERYRGVYFPSRYEDVRAVAYDTEHFSSRRIIVRSTPPPRIPAPPITSDPPEHRPAKNLLLPAFTPDAIKEHEPRTREICARLIEGFAGKGGCDAAGDYAQEIPV